MTEPRNIEWHRSPSGDIELAVRTDEDTVWVSADQMVDLFGRDKSTISRHLRNVFGDGELDREAAVADFATTAADGKTYRVAHYSLDAVISVGYRVKSREGVVFRRWATQVLRTYLLAGVAANERRLERLGSIVEVMSRSTSHPTVQQKAANLLYLVIRIIRSRTAASAAPPLSSCTSSPVTARSTTLTALRASRTPHWPRSRS